MVIVPAEARGHSWAGADRLWLVRGRINQRHLVFSDALSREHRHEDNIISPFEILRPLITVSYWHRHYLECKHSHARPQRDDVAPKCNNGSATETSKNVPGVLFF